MKENLLEMNKDRLERGYYRAHFSIQLLTLSEIVTLQTFDASVESSKLQRCKATEKTSKVFANLDREKLLICIETSGLKILPKALETLDVVVVI